METQVMIERASLLLDQRRFKDAEAHIKKVLEQEPENDYALSLLARCYLNNKQHEKGIEVIQQAISIDPNESFYFYLLAFGYYQTDENYPAIYNLEKAIELNPYVAEYFGLLSFVLTDEKRFEEALSKANEGLQLEADNVTCLNARSMALNKLRRTDDAIDTMNDALTQDPDNEVTHTTVGWNLLERGRNKEAQHHFMEALRIDPNFSSAKVGLKEALKSKLLLYKWLLQYSFWVNNQGRNLQVALPIILYVVFRILMAAAGGDHPNLKILIGAIYIFIVVTSWTIGSIANFVLLFHPLGKYSLTNTEKWAGINAVTALVTGIIILLFSNLSTGTLYERDASLIGMICISLALPLGNIEYPIRLKNQHWKRVYPVALIALGLLTIVTSLLAPEAALLLFVIYGLGFLVYLWGGIIS